MKRFLLLLLTLLWPLCLTACTPAPKNKVTIAIQYGVAYAPVELMRMNGTLERALPDYTIEWKQLGGPVPIREGMLAGEIDLGCMGIGPVLIGIDQGMPWRYCAALSSNEVAFVVNKPSIKTLADIEPKDRIAILSPGCTQHILLCMAAKEQLGNALALDGQLVSLSHPDALSAMLAGGEVVMHVSCPPYTDLELQNGMTTLFTGEDLMGGPFTFISCVAMEKFHDQSPEAYQAFLTCLHQAVDELNADLPKAAQQLASVYGLSDAELYAQMSRHGTIYGGALRGIDKLAQAMAELGFLKAAPTRERYAFAGVPVESAADDAKTLPAGGKP
ncbi:MAG: ABC transporter substrate-binding protein [Clostridia bacterium]